MPAPRRENDSRRVVQSIKDHSDTMEALRRATAGAYDPNKPADFNKAFTFTDGADIISKGEGPGAKYFKNNVRKI